jgi:nitroreductase
VPDTAFGFAYDPVMDVYLAIASRREVREYTDAPIPPEIVQRILDAGRLSGSSRNTQEWEFVVVTDHEALSKAVYSPGNLLGATVVVALAGAAFPLDMGRAAQNMMLAAWNEGVGSCPNGISDAELAERIVGAPVRIILTFGYPAKPRDPNAHTAAEWSDRAKRKPFDEVVRTV